MKSKKSKTTKTPKINIWYIIIPVIIVLIIIGIILYFVFRKKNCIKGNNNQECSGNGNCKNGICICNSNYSGNACQNKLASECKNDTDCQNGQKCQNGVCQCENGKNLGDDTNCGNCGNACVNGETCQNGVCQCQSGTLNDNNNCGKCGNVCSNDQKCIAGSCQNLKCENNSDCQNGQICKSGMCQCESGTLNDNNNCDTCGTVCQNNKICKNGICQCKSGVLNDDNNCGDCGTICQDNKICQSGTCQCESGVLNDDNNCGKCGNICTTGQKCVNGGCQISNCTNDSDCKNGQKCKDGVCQCENGKNLGEDTNCEKCGNICLNGETCVSGICQCQSGTLNDNRNCGKCGNICLNKQTCNKGICKCQSGKLGDNNNCGNCGASCLSGQTCQNTTCKCQNGELGDNNNCGNCDKSCLSGQKCVKNNCVECVSDGECLFGQSCIYGKCKCKIGNLGDDQNCEKCGQNCIGKCVKKRDNSYQCCPFGMTGEECNNLISVPELFPPPTSRQNAVTTLQNYLDPRIPLLDKKIIDILSPANDSSCGFYNYNYFIILFTPGCQITSDITIQHGQEYLSKNCQKIQNYINTWKKLFVDGYGNSLYKSQDMDGLMYGTLGSNTYESINFSMQNSYNPSKTVSINIYHDNSNNICVTTINDVKSDDPSCPDGNRTKYSNVSIFAPPDDKPYYAGLVIIGPPL